MNRQWIRWRCEQLDQLLSFHVAGAGKGCVAWVAMLTEPSATKPWAKALPAPVAKAIGGIRRPQSMSVIAPIIVSHAVTQAMHIHSCNELPLEKVYLRREDHQWWELTVEGCRYKRGCLMQSRRLTAACEAKFLQSV